MLCLLSLLISQLLGSLLYHTGHLLGSFSNVHVIMTLSVGSKKEENDKKNDQ